MPEEWDSGNQYEKKLMSAFSAADKREIPTKRLYIFSSDNFFIADKGNPTSFLSLKNLLPYLKNETYTNTSSYAISQKTYEQLTKEQKGILGLGFCSFNFTQQNKDILVRDVCVDLGMEKSIRGEINFNQELIVKVKGLFESFVEDEYDLLNIY